MIGGSPSKPKAPPPPPSTPTRAQARQFALQAPTGTASTPSFVNTTPQGLLQRANTRKRTLIGGSAPA